MIQVHLFYYLKYTRQACQPNGSFMWNFSKKKEKEWSVFLS